MWRVRRIGLLVVPFLLACFSFGGGGSCSATYQGMAAISHEHHAGNETVSAFAWFAEPGITFTTDVLSTGSCAVSSGSEISYPSDLRYLDAGPAVRLVGASGTLVLPRVGVGPEIGYAATTSAGFFTPGYTYQVVTTAGGMVPVFSSPLLAPQDLTVTSPSSGSALAIDRSAPLLVQWTAPGIYSPVDAQVVQADPSGAVLARVHCLFAPEAGQGEFRPSLLSSLLPDVQNSGGTTVLEVRRATPLGLGGYYPSPLGQGTMFETVGEVLWRFDASVP